ncbi:hypothetical protein [Streptomyces sp. NRRL F-5123]|uniref:hypothetical protein n=1 Tax=Streptomyces sp. NRRL F-5123 TaxID=1463856 RepID=UPI0004E2025D|nr:hypothetical protein [Streptomyces sp. NRRL F-5123]
MSSDSGHVKPIKSKYQAKPWQPTVDSSDHTQSSAGKDYTDVYGGTVNTASGDSGKGDGRHEKSGNEPHLSMAYTTAPNIVATKSGGAAGDKVLGMEAGRFSIQLSALISAEQTCLNATSSMVTGYGTLKAAVDKAAADDNYFGQQTGQRVANTSPSGQPGYYGGHWVADEADSESVEFAATIIPQMKNLLNTIGNVIEACGQFNALLNNAGQSYASMDLNSAFKDAGT